MSEIRRISMLSMFQFHLLCHFGLKYNANSDIAEKNIFQKNFSNVIRKEQLAEMG